MSCKAQGLTRRNASTRGVIRVGRGGRGAAATATTFITTGTTFACTTEEDGAHVVWLSVVRAPASTLVFWSREQGVIVAQGTVTAFLTEVWPHSVIIVIIVTIEINAFDSSSSV